MLTIKLNGGLRFMDISKQTDDFFFRLQMQMHSFNIDAFSKNLRTHELNILHTINRCSDDKGGVYVSEIAKTLELPMSAISRMLKHLEDDLHYIVRKQDTENRRHTIVSITDRGKLEYDRTMELAKSFISKVFQCFTLEERILYCEMMEKIKNATDIEYAKLYDKQKKEIKMKEVHSIE